MASNSISWIPGEMGSDESLHRSFWKLVLGPLRDVETILKRIPELQD